MQEKKIYIYNNFYYNSNFTAYNGKKIKEGVNY